MNNPPKSLKETERRREASRVLREGEIGNYSLMSTVSV
jgi:hypothetical protein